MSRRRPDGELLEWRLLLPDELLADGLVPFFIDWGGTESPARSAAPGCELLALRGRSTDPVGVRFALSWLGISLAVSLAAEAALEATLLTPVGELRLR